MNIPVASLEDLDIIVEAIDGLVQRGYRIFLLSGELGSGKTTLVQALCRSWGVQEAVSSPTFSLVNSYSSPVYGEICHMDLYRLEKHSDLVQIGLEEYLESGQICLIEWPGVANEYFFPPYVKVEIEVNPNNIRIFKITTYDAVDA
ncbi:MAG TPA: tRNA (adenosine(37)-N6)-threonylcarbamoyltransferase complex ATPase subunit type 1 TsaE [Saprospiraceae bacterium]|nr:tRNA (adenosine(37)-N6)-threonylcarbamoyltransferase complex ATPase subunit type 1 TsaE [Saprospiraceae bacterium]